MRGTSNRSVTSFRLLYDTITHACLRKCDQLPGRSTDNWQASGQPA